jgi:hypothetical protein
MNIRIGRKIKFGQIRRANKSSKDDATRSMTRRLLSKQLLILSATNEQNSKILSDFP